jgi:hypothetical protein
MRQRLVATSLLAASVWPAAALAAAPAQLQGKSVVISTSATRTFRPVGGTEQKTINSTSQLSVYVSSAGRTFVRSDRSITRVGGEGGRNKSALSKAVDTAPGESLKDTGNGSASFSGKGMTVTFPFASGARQVTVSFNDSFSSCTATVMNGREGSKNMVIRSRYNGQMNEVLSEQISVSGCSIRDGNVFGGQ